jgi:hypothetical protein
MAPFYTFDQLASPDRVKSIRLATLDGAEVYRVETLPFKDWGYYGEFFVDPAVNYLIRKATLTADDSNEYGKWKNVYEFRAEQFAEAGRAIFFPRSTTIRNVSVFQDARPDMVINDTTVSFRVIDINQTVDPAKLSYTIPAGAIVVDLREGQSHVMRKDGVPVRGNRRTIQGMTPKPLEKPWTTTHLIVIAVACIVLVFMAWRLWSAKKSLEVK